MVILGVPPVHSVNLPVAPASILGTPQNSSTIPISTPILEFVISRLGVQPLSMLSPYIGSHPVRFIMSLLVASIVMSLENQKGFKRFTHLGPPRFSVERYWWRLFVNCIPLDALEMTLDQFTDAFLERFVPYSLRDWICDELDRLEQGSKIVADIANHAKMIEGILRESPIGAKKICYFVQGGLLSLVVSSPIKAGYRGFFMFHMVSHLAKHYPRCVIRATFISAVRGRGTTKGARSRGSGACGGGREIAQPVGGRDQCYAIPAKLEADTFGVMITGLLLIYFRSASVLFDPGSTFSSVSTYFTLGFYYVSEPFAMPIRVSIPWSDACEASFQKLKDWLTSAPILTLPKEGMGFTIYCNTSSVGLGVVLMHEGTTCKESIVRFSQIIRAFSTSSPNVLREFFDRVLARPCKILSLTQSFNGHKPSMGRSQLICTGGILMVTVQYSNDYKDDKNEALHTQYIFRTDVPHGGPAFHAAGTVRPDGILGRDKNPRTSISKSILKKTPSIFKNSIVKNMSSKEANDRSNENQSAPQPVQADFLNEHVSYAEFRAYFTALAHSTVSQNNQLAIILSRLMAHAPRSEEKRSETTRVSAELEVMCVLDVAIQDRGSDSVLRWVRKDQESSPDVVTGTLQVYYLHVYALLDLGASLSFVTPYIVVDFGVIPKILANPFSVSTPVGKSIIARWVYRNFPVMVSQKVTSVDLVELEMTNFDVILDMD
ncbi:hypothetical protein FXO38_05610 [Capsicum annuum]|nr:hypothetical protein FXO38_05610 [Capsicum annuum]